jgi:hypothetical protein
MDYNDLGYNELGYNELSYNELNYDEIGYLLQNYKTLMRFFYGHLINWEHFLSICCKYIS